MGDAQGLIAETDGEFVHPVHDGKIVCHPAIAEHPLNIAGFYNEFGEDGNKIQPSCIIIKSIFHTAPLAPPANLSLIIKNA